MSSIVARRARLSFVLAALALVGSAIATPRSGSERAVRPHPKAERQYEVGFIQRNEESGQEGDRISGGFASEDYDNRAFPKKIVRIPQSTGSARAAASVLASSVNADGVLAGIPSWSEVAPGGPTVPDVLTDGDRETTRSGRITALAIDPNCVPGDCRLWVGAAGGGIWRTDDALAASPTFTPVGDEIGTGAIGSIALDPNDPSGNTIYVGTGEPNGSGDSEAGKGLFVSTDGGDSWNPVAASLPISKGRSIATIAVEPGDANHILIGTALARHGDSSVDGGRRTPPDGPKLGLYETTDGGSTWSLAFSRPANKTKPRTGNDWFQGGVNRIEFDPNDPGTVYAAVIGYGLWRRSPALDGDTTWHQTFATVHPHDLYGDRSEFDLVDDGSATRIYLDDSSDYYGVSGLFRVDDANVPAAQLTDGVDNTAWKSLSSDDPKNKGFGSYNLCPYQCGYDLFVASPDGRPDVVYVGGSMQYDEVGGVSNGRAVMRSTDAGATFQDVTWDARNPAEAMHADQHAIVFDPGDTNIAFMGSDGGLVRTSGTFSDASGDCTGRGLASTHLANCQAWLSSIPSRTDSLNATLGTLQFYSLSVNPSDPTDVIGGTQDNGTLVTLPSWSQSIYGDGGQSAIDPAHPDIRLHTYFFASPDVNFSGNDPLGWDWIGDPLYLTEPQSFYPPFTADPTVPNTFYAGLASVYRTRIMPSDQTYLDKHCNEFTGDFAVQCGHWVALGGGPGTPSRLTSKAYGGRAGQFVVAVEPANDGHTIWAATRTGRVFVTKNANGPVTWVSWNRIDSSSTPGRFVSGIAVDPQNPNRAFVSYSGYSAYTPGEPGHVFEVRYHPSSRTASFTNISHNLGDQPILDVAFDRATGDLYIGSDYGVYRLQQGARRWRVAGAGLPSVAVYGLTLDAGSRTLFAATHGRGAWTLPLP